MPAADGYDTDEVALRAALDSVVERHGVPDVPGTAFDPDEIAEQYWLLHQQEPDAWQHELLYRGAQETVAVT